MADPVNDFSFDPYQVEETTLAEKLKQAMAKQLRVSAPRNDDIVGGFNTAFDRMRGAREEQGVYDRRKQISDDYERSMLDATKGYDPEIRDLFRNPATRGIGLEMLRKKSNERSDQEAMDKAFGRNPSAPDAPTGGADLSGAPVPQRSPLSYSQLVDLQNNPNTKVAAAAKAQLEAYYKPHDPKLTGRLDTSGNMQEIPGAADLYGKTQGAVAAAKNPYETITTKDEYGRTITVPKSEITGGGPSSALPNATGAAGATPVGPAPVAPVSASPGPVSALPNATGRAGPAPRPMVPGEAEARAGFDRVAGTQGGVIPPQVQLQRDMERMNMLQDEAKQYAPNSREGVAIRQEMVQTSQRIAQLSRQGPPPSQIAAGPGAPPPQGPAPSPMSPIGQAQAALPQGQPGFTPNQEPVGPRGVGPTPMALKGAENTQKANVEAYQKWQEARRNTGQIGEHLDELEKINKKPTFGGPLAGTMSTLSGLGATFGGEAGPRADNLAEFNSIVQTVVTPMLKAYGYNPSNIDLTQALKALPNENMSATQRQKVIEQIRRGLAFEEGVAPYVDAFVKQGYDFAAAQQMAGKEYLASKQKAGAAGNPTEAGGQALPSASAVQNRGATGSWGGNEPAPTPPGGDGPGPWHEGLGRNIQNVGDALGGLNPFTPPTQASRAGGEGVKDAWVNLLRGGAQAIGLGDREAWAQEKARQDERAKNPQYAAGKTFGDIFNPTAAIGGGATTIPKLAMAGALQAGLQPQVTAGDQIIAGATGGAAGAGLGLLGKLFPTITSSVPDLNKYLEQFKSVKPTSAQLNPGSLESAIARSLGVNDAAALAQVKAITQDLTKKAGMEGGTVSREVLDAHKEKLGKAYEALFPDTGRPVGLANLSTMDQAALKAQFQSIVQPPGSTTQVSQSANRIFNSADTPALQRLRQTLDPANQGAIQLNPADLHRAWKEVGTIQDVNPQAAKQVRDLLENIVGKTMSPDRLREFKKLNSQYSVTQDIDRVYSMAGTGKGEAAGYLAPSKLEAQMGKGPNVGSATDEAAQLVKQLNMRDVAEPSANTGGVSDFISSIIKPTVGKGIQTVDSVIQSLPAKKVAELIRNLGITGGQAAVRQQSGE